jgi:sugar (pentulose or hexulose) kinase
MPETVLGVDLGTTTITALALEPRSGQIVAQHTVANDAEITSPADKARGRSEWDPRRMAERACQCLRSVSETPGVRGADIAGLGITGQQHGVVLVDQDRQPLTPLVNWQDRRGDERVPGNSRSFVQQASLLSGDDAPQRAGCRLATGFMGVTLFWWKVHGLLPARSTACFIGDYLSSALTGQPPVSDPTNAASSGLLDVRRRCWDAPILEALGLPASLFPEIREADQPLGPLMPAAAASTSLPVGLPVFVALGDSQAAFLGSVEDCQHDVLINVGTGAQVIAAIDDFSFVPPLETRPLPRCGNLLVSAALCGGRAYAVLEEFFRRVLHQLGGLDVSERIYDTLNRLADDVPSGSDGLRCCPLFAGTRAEPEVRASWSGVSPENFTPAHMARALLEGVADVLHEDYARIGQAAGKSYRRLVGSGNALRKNPVLRRVIAERFALPLQLLPHEEEAAIGAARMAALGTGIVSR